MSTRIVYRKPLPGSGLAPARIEFHDDELRQNGLLGRFADRLQRGEVITFAGQARYVDLVAAGGRDA